MTKVRTLALYPLSIVILAAAATLSGPTTPAQAARSSETIDSSYLPKITSLSAVPWKRGPHVPVNRDLNVTRNALAHIFVGGVAQGGVLNGKVQGMHYAAARGAAPRDKHPSVEILAADTPLPGMGSGPTLTAVRPAGPVVRDTPWKARVWHRETTFAAWKEKGLSTMFPANWTVGDTLDALNAAWGTAKETGNGSGYQREYTGRFQTGQHSWIDIQYQVIKDRLTFSVASAFPKAQAQ